MLTTEQEDLRLLVERFCPQQASLLLYLAVEYCLAGSAKTTCYNLNTFIPEQLYNKSHLWVIHTTQPTSNLATTALYIM